MDISIEEQLLLEQIPNELLVATIKQAQQNADRVAIFLNTFCESLAEQFPERGIKDCWKRLFPAWFLLELAGALQFLSWESNGLIRSEMNLPPAHEKIREIFLKLNSGPHESQLSRCVLRVFCEFFSWNALTEFNAYILVDAIDEDQLTDRIADFLWNNRNLLETNHHG